MAGREASLRGSITFSLIAFVQMADYQQFYLYKVPNPSSGFLIRRIDIHCIQVT